jgi:iron complex transport system substrate-binding protein
MRSLHAGVTPSAARSLHVAISRLVRVVSSATLALLVLAACGDKPAAKPASEVGTVLAVDHFGDTLRALGKVERVVSLTPATTEILFAIGAGDRVVGRDEYSKWPDAARQVPSLGPGLRPNVEAVIAARPDLVLLYASQDNRPAAQRLRAAGIMTAAFKVDSIEQFERTTRLLGRLTRDSARAALVADTVLRTLDSVRTLTASLPRVSVVMPVYDNPLYVIGGGSFMSQLVTIAGGRNIYDSIPQPSPAVTFEDIVRRDPDAVLVGPERAASTRAHVKWRGLRAVRSGRVLVLDTSLTLRPAVRLGEGAVSLARLLHPELSK